MRRLGKQLLRECGCALYSTEQVRRSKVSEGIPDTMAFHQRRGFAFVEWKHPEFVHPDGDRKHAMSQKQRTFRDWCRRTATTYLLVSRLETVRDWIASAP